MGRRTSDEMEGADLRLLYIAGNLPDAQAAERCLTDMETDYCIALEPYTTTSPIGGVYMGAFFYVPAAQSMRCRAGLKEAGLTDIVPDSEEFEMENPHGA